MSNHRSFYSFVNLLELFIGKTGKYKAIIN